MAKRRDLLVEIKPTKNEVDYDSIASAVVNASLPVGFDQTWTIAVPAGIDFDVYEITVVRRKQEALPSFA